MQTRSSTSSRGSEEGAQPAAQKRSRTKWQPEEEAAFLDFLLSNKSEMVDNSMFKDATLRDAATSINKKSGTGTDRALKTLDMCKSKWKRMKDTHKIILELRSKSGYTWDDKGGMGVKDPKNDQAWLQLASTNAAYRPFAKSGWVHCQVMDGLMDGKSRATGSNVHRGTQLPASTSQFMSSSSSFNSAPGSTSSSKRKLLDFDASGPSGPSRLSSQSVQSGQPSSSKKKRSNAPQDDATMDQLSGAVMGFQDTFRGPQMSEGLAIERLLHEAENTDMKEWLPLEDTLTLVDLFQGSASMSDAYLAVAKKGTPEFIKTWLQLKLRRWEVDRD